MPGVTIVRIEDQKHGPPTVHVEEAPAGYNLYVGPLVNNPEAEHGGLINLLGVDPSGAIANQGWRFIDPALPEDAARNGLHILWITHDHSGPFCNGDLQIGFNSVFPGRHYANPLHTRDTGLGPATEEWTTVYADEVLQLEFRSLKQRAAVPCC